MWVNNLQLVSIVLVIFPADTLVTEMLMPTTYHVIQRFYAMGFCVDMRIAKMLGFFTVPYSQGRTLGCITNQVKRSDMRMLLVYRPAHDSAYTQIWKNNGKTVG